MFRNRRNSQKPSEELFDSFRRNYPEVGPGSTSGSSPGLSASSSGLFDPGTNQSSLGHDHEDLDPTPKAAGDPWRFTPSLLDPNSVTFAAFANQPPGYYTPTPGGTSTAFPQQSGDVQTPNIGIGIGTPLSLSTSDQSLHASSGVEVHGFQPQTIHPHDFHNYHPFGAPPMPDHYGHPQSMFEPQDATGAGSPMEVGGDSEMRDDSPLVPFSSRVFSSDMPDGAAAAAMEKFRFHVTLNAPTAMIKLADEIPVTYLNKGQPYSISIVDTVPPPPGPHPVQYRTFIRISFEDESQRQRPAACWQLWKEGRGTSEAHQRGGKLQAVEYVNSNASVDEDSKRARVDLEQASFDGFSVAWSPGTNGSSDCSVAVRFNFLSTDFSHSKGVKGIPVRLCAKTQVVSTGSPQSAPPTPETCYCKVKLFRDHGAERKLSNDVAHVKKSIDKLKQQISQIETGMKDFGKKKRADSVADKGSSSGKPGKAPKHKRTWSMSSANSSGGPRAPAEEDLHLKLATMQDMFTSTRPVSVLYLRGEEGDDPDLYPVQLSGEMPEITDDVWARRASVATSATTNTSSFVSPSPSSSSLHSQGGPGTGQQTQGQTEWTSFVPMGPPDVQSSNPQHLASPPDQPVRIQKTVPDNTGLLPSWIEAIDIDASYKPPLEQPPKPIMCIYILPITEDTTAESSYHRAVYLTTRSAQELTHKIAAKCNIDPTTVARLTRVHSRGFNVEVDDEVVRELPEGQDMKVELHEIITGPLPTKREWDVEAPDSQSEGEMPTIKSKRTKQRSWELKLVY